MGGTRMPAPELRRLVFGLPNERTASMDQKAAKVLRVPLMGRTSTHGQHEWLGCLRCVRGGRRFLARPLAGMRGCQRRQQSLQCRSRVHLGEKVAGCYVQCFRNVVDVTGSE